jgi:redox-sensitive bicupin YhaK (pirin superfamily)
MDSTSSESLPPQLELILHARPRDLGSLIVRRVLPARERKLVGPFVFFDHMGPVVMAAGSGVDVRPHPHIGLATVTYLFDGEIVHRDSLGYEQPIRPADVNWMVAGRGIVHSERTAPERRQQPHPLHGIQAWVALPKEAEECEPSFVHHPASALPRLSRPGIELHLIAGEAYGLRSPVAVASPTFYAAVQLSAATELALTDEHVERALYVVSGEVECAGRRLGEGDLAVVKPGSKVSLLAARSGARLMLLGGAPLTGERHIFWNFVSTSEGRIEQAKQAWREQTFARVPGDEIEFTPLPE